MQSLNRKQRKNSGSLHSIGQISISVSAIQTELRVKLILIDYKITNSVQYVFDIVFACAIVELKHYLLVAKCYPHFATYIVLFINCMNVAAPNHPDIIGRRCGYNINTYVLTISVGTIKSSTMHTAQPDVA